MYVDGTEFHMSSIISSSIRYRIFVGKLDGGAEHRSFLYAFSFIEQTLTVELSVKRES